MRILNLIIILSFITSFACAEITKPPAMALEYWLRSQDKFEGASVRTRQFSNGTFEIFEWKVTGVKKPTSIEVMAIIQDWEDHADEIEEAKMLERKKETLRVLGITKEKWDEMVSSTVTP